MPPALRATQRPPEDQRGLAGVKAFDSQELTSGHQFVEAYAKFVLHDKSGMVSIQIVDSRSHTVIREIPSEQVIRMAEELQKYMQARVWPARALGAPDVQ